MNDRNVSDLVHCIAGPLIVFETSWADTIPDWVRQEIKLHRMLQQMRALKVPKDEKRATDIETMAYMMPCTMIAPMGRDWTEIYLWLAHKCMVDAGRPPEHIKGAAEIAPKELNEDQKRQLGDLQRWLWEGLPQNYNLETHPSKTSHHYHLKLYVNQAVY